MTNGDRPLHDRDEEQRRSDTIAEGRAALDSLLAAAHSCVAQHSAVLVAKRRQTVFKDDYGRDVTDGWDAELAYFRENVLLPELFERCTVRAFAIAQLGLVLDKESHFSKNADAVEDVHEYMDGFLDAYVNAIVQSLDEEAAPEVLQASGGLTPSEYERMCASELRRAGWSVRVCGRTGDQGVDLVAHRDGACAVFQCKLYSSPIGNAAVQEVYTGKLFHSARVAAVVGPSGFTPSARAAAKQTGVHLLHHSQLANFSG